MTNLPFTVSAGMRRTVAGLLFRMPLVQRHWVRRYAALEFHDTPWTPLRKPLSQCRVALVTTAGVHLASDPPFDMADPQGDASYRVIPGNSRAAELTITHDYYDHRDADRDINVVFPIEILRALHAEGAIGATAPLFYSLMGHIEGRHVHRLMVHTAPEIAVRLRAEDVDVALFTPA